MQRIWKTSSYNDFVKIPAEWLIPKSEKELQMQIFVSSNVENLLTMSWYRTALKVWSSIYRNKRKLLLCPRITEDLPYRSHDHHIVSLFLILGTTSGCLEMRAKRSVVPHLSIPMTWKYGRHFNFPLTEVQQGFLCDELKVNGAWKIKIVLIIF